MVRLSKLILCSGLLAAELTSAGRVDDEPELGDGGMAQMLQEAGLLQQPSARQAALPQQQAAPIAADPASTAPTGAFNNSKEMQLIKTEHEQEANQATQEVKSLKDTADHLQVEADLAKKEAEKAAEQEKEINATAVTLKKEHNNTIGKQVKDAKTRAESANTTLTKLQNMSKMAEKAAVELKNKSHEADVKATAAGDVVHMAVNGTIPKENGIEPGPEELKLRAEQAQVRQEAVAEAAAAALAYEKAREKADLLTKQIKQADEDKTSSTLTLKDTERQSENEHLNVASSVERKVRDAAAEALSLKEKADAASKAAKAASEKVSNFTAKEKKDAEERLKEEEKQQKLEAKKNKTELTAAISSKNFSQAEKEAKEKLEKMQKNRTSMTKKTLEKQLKDVAEKVNKSSEAIKTASANFTAAEAAVKKAIEAEQKAKEKLGQAEEESKKEKLKQAEVAQAEQQFTQDQQVTAEHKAKALEAAVEQAEKNHQIAKEGEHLEQLKKLQNDAKTAAEKAEAFTVNATKAKLATLKNESAKAKETLKNQTAAASVAKEKAVKLSSEASDALKDAFAKGHGDLGGSQPSAPVVKEGLPVVTTSLTMPAKIGDNKIEVKSTSSFYEGDVITIGEEEHTVRGFGSIFLAEPLKADYPAGTTVTVVKDIKSKSTAIGGASHAQTAPMTTAPIATGAETPVEDGPTFTVSVDKVAGAKLGFLSRVEDKAIVIEGLKDGLLKEWSQKHPNNAIKVGDKIVEINGVKANGAGMAAEVTKMGSMNIVIQSGKAAI